VPRVGGIPGPYWFFFYSFDCNEPVHIHVRRDRQHCKFWLAPAELAWNHGFSPRELKRHSTPSSGERTDSHHGMSTAVSVESRIDHVKVTDETITAYLIDGRVISVPLAWSWRLSEATPAQRANWELIGDGHGVHWPDVDEDLSADGMLNGVPAHRPATARAGRLAPAHQTLQPKSRAQRTGKTKRRRRADRG
jgi:hypothetical protein